MRLFSSIKQLKYHPEFRIKPPIWPKDLLSSFEKLIHAVQTKEDIESSGQPVNHDYPERQMQFLGELGTGLWRLKKNMVHPETGEPHQEMKKAYRHLEDAWEALKETGVEIQDHTNLPYHPGMALKVISFQPVKGIHQERVIETITPSTYYKDQMIRMGEVIVGTVEE
jgi:hypothetical protein